MPYNRHKKGVVGHIGDLGMEGVMGHKDEVAGHIEGLGME